LTCGLAGFDHSPPHTVSLLFLFLFFFLFVFGLNVFATMTTIFEPLTTGTVSIQEANAYKALSPCVRDCIYTRGSNNDIEGALKCGDDAIYNTCFCDTASRSTATSFLSSCILTKCAFNANSLVAAVTVYEKYCTLEPIPLTIPTSKTSS